MLARDFLTDEVWKAWKTDYDGLLAFRKTIKGKPDQYDRLILDMNNHFIEYYQTVLFHGDKKICDCRRCSQARAAESKKL
jgi:hypothetical protein